MIYIDSLEEFDDAVEVDGIVVVQLSTQWCGPCKAQSQIFDKMDTDNFTVYKVDVDKLSQLAIKYGVRSVPTILFFKDGELKNTNTGMLTKDEVLRLVGDLNGLH